jgi:hypothetical protein
MFEDSFNRSHIVTTINMNIYVNYYYMHNSYHLTILIPYSKINYYYS